MIRQRRENTAFWVRQTNTALPGKDYFKCYINYVTKVTCLFQKNPVLVFVKIPFQKENELFFSQIGRMDMCVHSVLQHGTD